MTDALAFRITYKSPDEDDKESGSSDPDDGGKVGGG